MHAAATVAVRDRGGGLALHGAGAMLVRALAASGIGAMTLVASVLRLP